MAGRIKDLTKGTPWKIIILFSIPIAISYILQQLYNVFDLFMIGNMLSETSFASVGTTTPLSLFVLMFATGTATGFSVITSQKFGAGDFKAMKKSFVTGVLLCILLGLVLTILSTSLCEVGLLAVGVKRGDSLFNDAYQYLFIVFLGTIANIFYNYFSSILRAVGNTKAPLLFLGISAVINIGLNYVFLAYTPLGVAGPAIGTVIAQTISSIVSFIYIQIRYPELKFSIKEMKLDIKDAGEHLKRGLPLGVQFSFIYIALIVLQREINLFGEGAITSFSAANKLDALFLQPANAIGTAVVTFVGQNFGAKKYKRIKTGILQAGLVQIVIASIVTVIALSIKDRYIFLMIKSPSDDAIKYAPIVMLFIGLSQYTIAAIFLFRNALQATNHSFAALITSIFQAVIRIVVALTLPGLIGFYGVAIATPISWLVSALGLAIMSIIYVFKKLPNIDYDVNELEVKEN